VFVERIFSKFIMSGGISKAQRILYDIRFLSCQKQKENDQRLSRHHCPQHARAPDFLITTM
jgi:hypothetical protein